MKGTQNVDDRREHERRPGVFVCQRLAGNGILLGFNRVLNPEDPDEVWPYAWCDACDDVYVDEHQAELLFRHKILRLLRDRDLNDDVERTLTASVHAGGAKPWGG